MNKVKLRAMVIIVLLSLVCFTVHAEECTRIEHEGIECQETIVTTHDDGSHEVVRYYDGVEVARSSISPGDTHEQVVENHIDRDIGDEDLPGWCLPCPPPNTRFIGFSSNQEN